MTNSIVLKELDLGYQKGYPVLSGISSEFKTGRIYGVLGLNGAGKTTLFKGISGLLCPLAGTIEAFGMKPFEKTKEYLQKIMFVPINPSLPNMTGKMFVKTYSPFWPSFSMDEFIEMTHLFTIDLDKKLSKLSYGQQKKFMLSFAMSANTELLMMDEPLAGLDMIAQKHLLMTIARNQKPHRILILSTNQAEEFNNIVTDVALIFQGKILLNSPVETIGCQLSFNNQDSYLNPVFEDGLNSICINSSGEYSDVDLKTLFYAVCSNNEFREILSTINNVQIHE